ncbi:MAG: hypothetical protein ACE5G8_02220 [Anaerolineae bacterium]
MPPTPPQPPTLVSTDLSVSLLLLVAVGAIIFVLMTPAAAPLEARLWPVLLATSTGLAGYVLYGIFAVQLAELQTVGDWIRGNTQTHWLTPLVTLVFAVMGVAGLALVRFIKETYSASARKEDAA